MHYSITQTELTCINILLKILEEAINRDCFSESEIRKIYLTIDKLVERSN